MTHQINEHGQPIGQDLPNWTGATAPTAEAISGRYCTLEALDAAAHAVDLFQSFQIDTEDALWTYMPVGPFKTAPEMRVWAEGASASTDPLFFAVVSKETGRAIGFTSFLRMDPAMGSIEVGFIAFSPALQRTKMATEAMYLMMARAFNDWGYRRYEWKCDALNAPSQAAAKRFGFSYDGLFKQASVYKGRNRDTAWFSVLDGDWPARERAFKAWLSPDNFDAKGQQKQSLSALMTS